MDCQEKGANLDIKLTPISKSATEIARTASSIHLKIMELMEHCQAAEMTLKALHNEVRDVSALRNESEKLLNDYRTRDKINSHNSESLLQTKVQLNKYKCDLKCQYLMMQKKTKENKAKQDRIIAAYKADWEKNLELYNSDPVVRELHELKMENENLRNEISRLENLIPDTEKRFSDLRNVVKNQVHEKIQVFAMQMTRYAKFVETERLKREAKTTELVRHVTIFASNEPTEVGGLVTEDVTEDVLNLSISYPVENLENHQEDDELYMMIISDELTKEVNLANELEYIDKMIVEQAEGFRLEKRSKDRAEDEEIQEGSSAKYADVSGTESHYFDAYKQQQSNRQPASKETADSITPLKEPIQGENRQASEKTQNLAEKSTCKNKKRHKGEEESKKTRGMNARKPETEDDISNASYDNEPYFTVTEKKKQRRKDEGIQSEGEDKFDFTYRDKPSSGRCSRESSVPFFVGNPNESLSSPSSNPNAKPDGDKSFKGFFLMGNNQNSPTPSFFKLF